MLFPMGNEQQCASGGPGLLPPLPLSTALALGSGGRLAQMLGDLAELLAAVCLTCLTCVLALSPRLGPCSRAVWRDSCLPTPLSPNARMMLESSKKFQVASRLRVSL